MPNINEDKRKSPEKIEDFKKHWDVSCREIDKKIEQLRTKKDDSFFGIMIDEPLLGIAGVKPENLDEYKMALRIIQKEHFDKKNKMSSIEKERLEYEFANFIRKNEKYWDCEETRDIVILSKLFCQDENLGWELSGRIIENNSYFSDDFKELGKIIRNNANRDDRSEKKIRNDLQAGIQKIKEFQNKYNLSEKELTGFCKGLLSNFSYREKMLFPDFNMDKWLEKELALKPEVVDITLAEDFKNSIDYDDYDTWITYRAFTEDDDNIETFIENMDFKNDKYNAEYMNFMKWAKKENLNNLFHCSVERLIENKIGGNDYSETKMNSIKFMEKYFPGEVDNYKKSEKIWAVSFGDTNSYKYMQAFEDSAMVCILPWGTDTRNYPIKNGIVKEVIQNMNSSDKGPHSDYIDPWLLQDVGLSDKYRTVVMADVLVNYPAMGKIIKNYTEWPFNMDKKEIIDCYMQLGGKYDGLEEFVD